MMRVFRLLLPLCVFLPGLAEASTTTSGDVYLNYSGGYTAVGYYATQPGVLTINGGSILNTTQAAYMGYQSGSSGTATVTGANSLWSISGSSSLYIGYQGT